MTGCQEDDLRESSHSKSMAACLKARARDATFVAAVHVNANARDCMRDANNSVAGAMNSARRLTGAPRYGLGLGESFASYRKEYVAVCEKYFALNPVGQNDPRWPRVVSSCEEDAEYNLGRIIQRYGRLPTRVGTALAMPAWSARRPCDGRSPLVSQRDCLDRTLPDEFAQSADLKSAVAISVSQGHRPLCAMITATSRAAEDLPTQNACQIDANLLLWSMKGQ